MFHNPNIEKQSYFPLISNHTTQIYDSEEMLPNKEAFVIISHGLNAKLIENLIFPFLHC